MKLTSPSIWICLTEECKVPPVGAIAALGAESQSLLEAIEKQTHANKAGRLESRLVPRSRCCLYYLKTFLSFYTVWECPA